MSSLIVIVFDDVESADKVRQALRGGQAQTLLHVNDAAVIRKDSDGNVTTGNEVSGQMKWGVGIGAAAGLLVSFMFPVLGMLAGAGVGAVVASSLGNSVDKKFVEDVTNELKPGTSALFVVGSSDNMDAVRSVLEPYKGTLIHTNLGPEIEEQIKQALK